MNTSATAMRVHFDENSMWVDLSDGRVIGVPLVWFPVVCMERLSNANKFGSVAKVYIGNRWTRTSPSQDCSSFTLIRSRATLSLEPSECDCADSR
jgi:hypothetical protein